MNKNRFFKKKLRKNEISTTTNILLNAVFIVYALMCLYPMALVIGTSFAEETYLNTVGYKVFPEVVSFDAYKYILANIQPILRAYAVTICVTIVGTVVSTVVIALYAYVISRNEFRYKKFFTFYLFFTMLFNGGMVPWYIVCTQVLDINNTYIALVWPALMSAWYVMIMRTFFTTGVPNGIVESARIDGAGEFMIFVRIVAPVSIPGIATVALFQMVYYWNDWYLPFMLTSDPEYANIQLYLKRILNNLQEILNSPGVAAQSGDALAKIPREGARMAICALAIGPIVLAYPFFQRFFVSGLTVGSIKG